MRRPLLARRQFFHDRRLVRFVFLGQSTLDVLALGHKLPELRPQSAGICGNFFRLLRRPRLGLRARDLADCRRHGGCRGGVGVVGNQHAEMPQRLRTTVRDSGLLIDDDLQIVRSFRDDRLLESKHQSLRSFSIPLGRPAASLRIAIFNRVAGGIVFTLAVGTGARDLHNRLVHNKGG